MVPSLPPTPPVASSRDGATSVDEDPLTTRLLAAAVDEFTEKGFEKAGVAAIARRAGVTTGAIYSRWSGKQEMMIDAIDLVMMDQLEQMLSSDMTSATDILSALGAELVVRSPMADALLAEAMVIARRDPEFHVLLHRRVAEQEARLASVIDRGKEEGLLDPALPTNAIVTLCHAITIGFAMFGSFDRDLPSAADWNAVIERLVTAAQPPPDPPSSR